MKNIQKKKKKFVIVLGEKFPPLKARKKTLWNWSCTHWKLETVCHLSQTGNREQFAYGEFFLMFQLMMTQVFIYSVSVKRFQYQLVAENLSLITRLTPLIVSFQLDTHTPLPPSTKIRPTIASPTPTKPISFTYSPPPPISFNLSNGHTPNKSPRSPRTTATISKPPPPTVS